MTVQTDILDADKIKVPFPSPTENPVTLDLFLRSICWLENVELLIGGDVVLKVEGVELHMKNLPEIRNKVNSVKDNAEITFTILRAGKVRDVTVKKN